MSIFSVALQRQHVSEMIADDPWTIVISHRGKTSGDVPETTTWTFTGSVKSSGPYRGLEQWSRNFVQEQNQAFGNHCLIAAYDEQLPRARDLVKATHGETGVVKDFHVVYSSQYPYKIEVLLDEIQ